MIKLEKPIYSQAQIIEDCVENMRSGDNSIKNHILKSKDAIVNMSEKYDKLASIGELGIIQEHETVSGGANKNDMKILYEQKFVGKAQGGRKYYDAIKLLAPYGRCPLCGHREIKTLDHYLPKSKYPAYAVTPYNLIPACSDCNTEKSSTTFHGRTEETIHPYYDDFTDEIWIRAKLIESDPITFEFFVDKPESWDKIKYMRACTHFKQFDLNELYKPYACEKFVGSLSRIRKLYKAIGEDSAKEHIKECIEEARAIRLNTWQAAMYEAILNSQWFWKEYLNGNTGK